MKSFPYLGWLDQDCLWKTRKIKNKKCIVKIYKNNNFYLFISILKTSGNHPEIWVLGVALAPVFTKTASLVSRSPRSYDSRVSSSSWCKSLPVQKVFPRGASLCPYKMVFPYSTSPCPVLEYFPAQIPALGKGNSPSREVAALDKWFPHAQLTEKYSVDRYSSTSVLESRSHKHTHLNTCSHSHRGSNTDSTDSYHTEK